MAKNLIISELEKKEILSLYGIIKEQDSISYYKPEEIPSDYLGNKGTFVKNYATNVYNVSKEQEKEEKKLKEEEKLKEESSILQLKYKNIIPVTEYYVSNNPYFKKWTQDKINASGLLTHLKKNILNDSIDFFKKYFDYKSNPAIIKKIVEISKKNGSVITSEDKVKQTIDKLINQYLPKINFKYDFEENRNSPGTLAYVYPSKLDATIYICPFGGLLIKNYEFESDDYLKESILHELGHLVDGYFNMMGIKFHSSDEGVVNTKSKVTYPHNNQSSGFLKFDLRDPYQKDKDEQFTRLKVLFSILSEQGLKIDSSYDEFKESISKSIEYESLSFGRTGCEGEVVGDFIQINKDCSDLNGLTKDNLYIPIYFGSGTNLDRSPSLGWLFKNYAILNIEQSQLPTFKIDFKYDLKKLYNDMVNEYVEIIDKSNYNSVTDSPDYPST
jgi:hypothetical protein